MKFVVSSIGLLFAVCGCGVDGPAFIQSPDLGAASNIEQTQGELLSQFPGGADDVTLFDEDFVIADAQAVVPTKQQLKHCPEGGFIVSYAIDGFLHDFRAVGIVGRYQEHRYVIPIVPGAHDVVIRIDGTGDADLYAGIGTSPSVAKYDCRPYLLGSSELCELEQVNDVLYVMVRGWSKRSTYQLRVTWSEEPVHPEIP